MNQDNRVLQRIGARELTREEIEHITGAFNPIITLTAFCSAPSPMFPKGDNDHEGCLL